MRVRLFGNKYQCSACLLYTSDKMRDKTNEPVKELKGLTEQEVELRVEQGLDNRADTTTDKSIKEIIFSNAFTYFNLIFLIISILLLCVKSYRNLTFLPIVIGNTLIGICLLYTSQPYVEVPQDVLEAAAKPLKRMLELAAK